MIVKRLKNILIERGFLLTLLLSVSCLFLFFGKLLMSPNRIYFSGGGDGLQAYFGALYHIKYDDSYWQMKGMNYPYGDQVFFTGCQPFVANTLKLINHFVNVYDYTVGILNLIMLVSIVLSALCIYLLFKHLRISYYYSAIAATAIAYLSPQLDRLGGHYSLTYQFAIPLFLLLLLKFYEQPTMKKSIWLGIFVFFITGTHFYFFGLFAITSSVYWSILYFSKEGEFGKLKFAVKHFFIQLVLPFLLVQLIMILIDHVNDRTSFPYGYLEYTSSLEGVFFPPGRRFYSPLFERIMHPKFPEWEGISYVGIIGVITFIAFLIMPIKRLFSKQYKQIFRVTDNIVLSIFFWASIPALLLAFGYPFKIKGLEWLLFYSGPLKQLRGIGRFTWILFYVINILAVYTIANLSIKKFPALKHILMITALFFMGYDAYIMASGRQDHLNNKIPVLEDKNNQLPEDQWLNQINTSDFQALITLPYTHIGSENIWVFSTSEIMKDGFLVSLKTGLPMLSLISSRTSLSQTYKNIQIIKEPYRKLEILKEFKNQKPILVIAKENELNQTEKDFLMHCQLLKQTPNYTIYSMQFDALLHISDTLYQAAKAKFNNSRTYAIDGLCSTDSVKTFVHDGFEKNENTKALSGKGCYEGSLKEYNVIYKGGIPNWKDQEYTLSFWMDDFTKDRYPRSTIELIFTDPAGNIYKTEYGTLGKFFTILDHQWGLLEKTIKLNGKDDQITVTIWSEVTRDEKEKFRADELLIRPSSTVIYKNDKGVITINNKTYFGNDI
jgi:hypothetical protein